MTNKEIEIVYNIAKNNGYRPSSANASKQVNNSDNTITHVGSNRTNINGATYYGASAATKVISGR